MIGRDLGFDARIADLGQIREAWTDSRRQAYLFDPTVCYPLSVDRAVWPTIFGSRGRDSELSRLSAACPLGLWDSADDVLAVLSTSQIKREEYVVLAVRIYIGPASEINETLKIRLDESQPCHLVTSDWYSIGFDVADGYLVSGLSNLHLPHAGQHKRDEHWTVSLNSRGLFSESATATRYAVTLNEEVKSHAPFFPYELLVNKFDLERVTSRDDTSER
jgi:hypothetical protein